MKVREIITDLYTQAVTISTLEVEKFEVSEFVKLITEGESENVLDFYGGDSVNVKEYFKQDLSGENKYIFLGGEENTILFLLD